MEMIFDALIEHENPDDQGHYVVRAATLTDAKLALRAMVVGKYRLDCLTETKASFEARKGLWS